MNNIGSAKHSIDLEDGSEVYKENGRWLRREPGEWAEVDSEYAKELDAAYDYDAQYGSTDARRLAEADVLKMAEVELADKDAGQLTPLEGVDMPAQADQSMADGPPHAEQDDDYSTMVADMSREDLERIAVQLLQDNDRLHEMVDQAGGNPMPAGRPTEGR